MNASEMAALSKSAEKNTVAAEFKNLSAKMAASVAKSGARYYDVPPLSKAMIDHLEGNGYVVVSVKGDGSCSCEYTCGWQCKQHHRIKW